MDDVWKGLTILLAFVAAYIAYQQFRLGREKFKLDLFEKRFAVFEATRKFLSIVLTEGIVKVEDLYLFRASVAEASFLFESDITNYLNAIDDRVVDLRAIQERLKHTPVDSRDSLVDKELATIIWLKEQLVKLNMTFSPYMKFHVWK